MHWRITVWLQCALSSVSLNGRMALVNQKLRIVLTWRPHRVTPSIEGDNQKQARARVGISQGTAVTGSQVALSPLLCTPLS